jgi:hypothetical protein
VPHAMQNRACSGFWAPQFGQIRTRRVYGGASLVPFSR